VKPAKGSNIYFGISRDGIWRTCKFDYHKEKDPVVKGSAKVIATSLKFNNVLEMKEYMVMVPVRQH
jgi:hypothetical protein